MLIQISRLSRLYRSPSDAVAPRQFSTYVSATPIDPASHPSRRHVSTSSNNKHHHRRLRTPQLNRNDHPRLHIRHCCRGHIERRPSFINNNITLMADQNNIMCEVEIQPDIQECVEIETMPVDMHDAVETIVECGDPIIPMQSLEGRDIILEAQEEIIDDSGDPLNLYDVPVPDASEIYVESSPGPSTKQRKRMKGGARGALSALGDVHQQQPQVKPRKWEQKQVQIKTMEGEFSVTMWASGTSDGECDLQKNPRARYSCATR